MSDLIRENRDQIQVLAVANVDEHSPNDCWGVVYYGDSQKSVLEKDRDNANSMVRGVCKHLDDVDERGRNTVARADVRDEFCNNGRRAREERGVDDPCQVCVGCQHAIVIHLLERRLLT